MGKTLTVTQILGVLVTGDFDEIIDTVEDDQVEVKGSPYQLVHDAQKQELAKDVSALGNAAGGIVLIGFETMKDPLNAVERITTCRAFDRTLVDLRQYENVLQSWLCPSMEAARIQWYPSAADSTKGVIAIVVPPETAERKPYVVRRIVAADGRVRGTLIGYYERIRDHIPETSAERLQGLLRDGLRFEEILSQRFTALERLITNHPQNATSATRESKLGDISSERPGLSDEELEERIIEAKQAVGRESDPTWREPGSAA